METDVLRTGGKALVAQLKIHGTERIFCVPGESFLDVLDALHDEPTIDLVVSKHEGGAANMAEADGKLTGKPGICFVTRGPGATHASIGVHIAAQDSTPMVLFIGQIETGHKGREAFQEVDYVAMFGSIAKWVVEIDDPARIPEIVSRAFFIATSGRPGPVVIALPENVLSAMTNVADARRYISVRSAISQEDLAAIENKLSKAERPLVIIGGSGWSASASQDLADFVDGWNLPVACVFRRQDAFDNRDSHYVGHMSLGMNPALAQSVRDADLILAIGTRLGDIATDGYTLLTPPRLKQDLIHIYPSADEIGRVFQPDIGVAATPAEAAACLATLRPSSPVAWQGWTSKARTAHQKFVASSEIPPPAIGVDMSKVISYLDSALPENAILTNGAGNYSIWLHRFYRYRQTKTQLAPTCGAMGYGLPAGIAAKARHPDRTVVVFAGDGCFLMYPQELATASEFGINIIVVIVNNGMYGTIRMHQEKRFPGRVSGTNIGGPDFVGLAKSFGASGERVTSAEDFPAAFERALLAGTPAVIELMTDRRQLTPTLRVDSIDQG